MPESATPALTPDYTDSGEGEGSSSPASETATKSRRLTAFYPNMNAGNKPLKPFSRSAAKRQSVMTLGSIEHLQHYFTKTGIAAKSKYVPASSVSRLAADALQPLQEAQQPVRTRDRRPGQPENVEAILGQHHGL